ncbi:helix-turn-helix domain-containing protein [Paraliobacillus sp. JSM ZJ581]|uniref:helix-turn-helix domain-containing protein n=1 Tax=Paraliobacillus sp. JSM ZJ581 TaxID=3342118 RepID=UPI0035A85E10
MKSISTNISQLRKAMGLTQEKLATLTGVSTSAVSKWESGTSFPDISILSPLARALNTDLNTLLSFSKALSDEKYREITAELDKRFVSSSYEATQEIAEKYIVEYPNSENLKLSIASKLVLFARYDELSDEDKIKIRLENALQLLQALELSSNPEIREQSLFIQAQVYLMLEEFSKTESLLEQISTQQLDTSPLYLAVLQEQNKKKEIIEYGSFQLFETVNKVCFLLDFMGKSLKESNQTRALQYYELSHKLHKIFENNLDYSSHAIAMIYLSDGQYTESAKWYYQFVKRLIDFPYDFSSHSLFSNVKLKLDASLQMETRKKLVKSTLDNEFYPELANNIEYNNALKRMKDFLSEKL